MKLTRLDINLNTYGTNEGHYTASIEYQDPKGSVKLLLDPAVSSELLKNVGPMLNKFALNGMADIQNAIDQATQNTIHAA